MYLYYIRRKRLFVYSSSVLPQKISFVAELNHTMDSCESSKWKHRTKYNIHIASSKRAPLIVDRICSIYSRYFQTSLRPTQNVHYPGHRFVLGTLSIVHRVFTAIEIMLITINFQVAV